MLCFPNSYCSLHVFLRKLLRFWFSLSVSACFWQVLMFVTIIGIYYFCRRFISRLPSFFWFVNSFKIFTKWLLVSRSVGFVICFSFFFRMSIQSVGSACVFKRIANLLGLLIFRYVFHLFHVKSARLIPSF